MRNLSLLWSYVAELCSSRKRDG
uniref:Uncharacterized protein n=1 Tax=Anguilla anguilla TaxID=7936 RepID=A0A0E9RRF3_ANGAN